MTEARAEPIIFVVSFHNVDFAKAGCELMQPAAIVRTHCKMRRWAA